MDQQAIPKFVREIRQARARLRSGRARLRIPELIGLHRRRPGAYFHSWPELFIQTGGATDFECPSGKFRLTTGNLSVIPSGVPHGETPVDTSTPYSILVFMQIGGDCLIAKARSDSCRVIQACESMRVPGGSVFFRSLEQTASQGTLPTSARHEYARGLVDSFLTAMLAMLQNPQVDGVTTSPHLVSEAEKLVRLSVSKPELSVASMAKTLGCSPDHLTRVFRAARGMTPSVWIARERIRLACELLEGLPHNVSEIGWTCGFRTPSYFVRVFRAYTGVTPRAWREHPELRVQTH